MKAIFTVSAESAGAVKAAKTTALKSALRRDSMFPLLVRVLFQALAAPRVLQKLPFRDSLSSSGFSGRATVRGSAGTGGPRSRNRPSARGKGPRIIIIPRGRRLQANAHYHHRRGAGAPPGLRQGSSAPARIGQGASAGRGGAAPARGLLMHHLEQAGGAHAAADAHGADDVFRALAAALDEGVPDHPGSRHAIRVADGDGAAVDVVLCRIDAEAVAAVERLHGERLVELPQADVVDGEPVLLEELRHREDRADAHLVGVAAGDRHAAV